jgi:hypothetical protein
MVGVGGKDESVALEMGWEGKGVSWSDAFSRVESGETKITTTMCLLESYHVILLSPVQD